MATAAASMARRQKAVGEDQTAETAANVARRQEEGVTVGELLVVLLIVGFILAAALPALTSIHRTAAMAACSRRISTLMMSCRARAVFQRQSIGLVFERRGSGPEWRCWVVEDGDGDGIRRDDINRGRDTRVSEVHGLTRLGILQDVQIPDPSGGGGLQGDLDDPVRAGRGDIVTFTSDGTATPCSIYLSDGWETMRVIRVYGATGKIHLFHWRAGWSRWRRPGS